jgi:hypothetical protein
VLVREAVAAEVPLIATEQLPAAPNESNESTGPEQGDAAQPEATETKTLPPPIWPRRSRPNQRIINAAITVIVAVIGFIFGGVGLNVFIIQDKEKPPSEVATLTPEPTPPPKEPAKVAAETTSLAPQTDIEESRIIDATPTDDDTVNKPNSGDTLIKPEPDSKPSPKAQTVVTLTASGYPWVRIRIDSATYVLDRRSRPTKSISLKPGSYSIAFQIDDEEPWHELGKVNIPAQPTASLKLQKPGEVIIE